MILFTFFRSCEFFNRFARDFCILFTGIFLISCSQESQEPISEELSKVTAPTIGGLASSSLSTTSQFYILNGECDATGRQLQWSEDAAAWVEVDGGCAGGTFSQRITVQESKIVYIRSLTKKGYTSPASVYIRLVLPPTSPSFQFVSSGSRARVGQHPLPFTASGTFNGVSDSSDTMNLDSHITGIVYGK